MTDRLPDARTQMRYTAPVFAASMLVYWAFRLLGATKDHAWAQARSITVNAIMDKVVEKAGIADPRHKDKAGIQAFFEGGPIDGSTDFVAECGAVERINDALPKGDARRDVYRRTDRMRGQQTVFEYRGLMIPPARASDMDVAA